MAERMPEPDIQRFYTSRYREADRLTGSAAGRAESTRTRELLSRLLPAPPALVLDVGGGPGLYARWLAARGYTVQLVDLVAAHVRDAVAEDGRAASGEDGRAASGEDGRVAGAVGDARRLPVRDGAADAVLLLGPLYHLTQRADRVTALREAARAARPGAVVAAAAISRHTQLIDLTRQGRISETTLPGIIAAYANGVNDSANWFTTAYFHRPEELSGEFAAAGLPGPQVYGIEGPLWPLLGALDPGPGDSLFADALTCARIFETDPAVLGASGHLLAVATVPSPR